MRRSGAVGCGQVYRYTRTRSRDRDVPLSSPRRRKLADMESLVSPDRARRSENRSRSFSEHAREGSLLLN